MTRRPRPSTLCLLLALATACGGSASQQTVRRDTLTRRQKDSIVGESGLPGASGIRRAQTASDSAASHAARLDSAAREP